MASPFLDYEDAAVHRTATDHYGAQYHHGGDCAPHVAGMLVVAGAFLVLLKVSGFRAMVGVGRG